MPRRVPRKRSYDRVFVGTGTNTVRLGQRDIHQLKAALNRAPSQQFLVAFEIILSGYKEHREEVKKSTVASIQRRIKAVVDVAGRLRDELHGLTLTDTYLIGNFRRLTDFEDVHLPDVLGILSEALRRIEREPKQGAMPGDAKRGLAAALCQILFEETHKTPTAQKNGSFDKVLRLALDIAERDDNQVRAEGGAGREDIMREALKGLKLVAPALALMPSLALLPSLGKKPRRE